MYPQQTLLSHEARTARVQQKREQVLQFLRGEVWTSTVNLARLLNLTTAQAVNKTVLQYERDGLVRRASIPIVGGSITLVGITSHGQVCATGEGEAVSDRVFEPGRVSARFVQHRLDLQHLRIDAEKLYWNWEDGDRGQKWSTSQARPDAIAELHGMRIAVECERSYKSIKRYHAILADRLRGIRAGHFMRVAWVMPQAQDVPKLKAIFTSFEYVNIGHQRIAIDPIRHHAMLDFVSFENFSSYLQKFSRPTTVLELTG